MFPRLLFVTLLAAGLVYAGAFESTADLIQLHQESASELVIACAAPEAELTQVTLQDAFYVNAALPQCFNYCQEGYPELPVIRTSVIIPRPDRIALEVIHDQVLFTELQHPLKPFYSGLSENPAYCFETPRYEDLIGAELYPAQPVIAGEPARFRDLWILPLQIFPYQYDPSANRLLRHEDFQFAVRFEGEPLPPGNRPPEDRLTQGTYRFLRGLTLNPPHRDNGGATLPRGGYLIIVGSQVNQQQGAQYVNPFADWKRAQGHRVEVLWAPNNIQDEIRNRYRNWNPPLEFVCLLGQNGNPAAPGDRNDVAFGWIDGNDFIAELAASRLSCTDAATAGLDLARCRGYQQTPWAAERDWFCKFGVAAMRVNGWTEGVRYSCKYIAEAARRAGMNPVWGWYNGDNNQQGFIDQWLRNHANMVFSRGNLNTNSFPQQSTFPMYITAGGGHTEGQWEAMWRIGSLQNLQGPSAISGTRHAPETMPCNVIIGAMGRGVIVEHMPLGWARAFAMAMLAYDNVGGRGPQGYATEFSMYGDPSQLAWLGEPSNIDVAYPQQISPGVTRIEAGVRLDGEDDPVANALVTLIQPGELIVSGFTDADGNCVLQLPEDWEGNFTLTVTGDDLLPFQHEVTSTQNVTYVGARLNSINDEEGGNGDGELNPGETVLLTFEAQNFSRNQAVQNATGRVTGLSSFATIADEVAVFERINAGQTVAAEQTFELTLSPSAPGGVDLGIVFGISAGANEWRSDVELPVVGPAIQLQSLVNGNIYEAQMSQLNVVLVNRGELRSPRLSVQLISLSQWVQVIDGLSSVGELNPNRSDRLDDGPFVINPTTLAIPGTIANMQLLLRVNDEDVPDTIDFQIQISRPRANTPLGPDPYGYICYDNTDQNWEQAPDYDWIEICPRERDVEIEGTPLPANRQQDFVYEIRLPFNFRYYQQDFDRISVCENGFICAGAGLGELRQFENYPLDQCINGSFGMIAPYWDELVVTNNNTQNIYTVYDEENHLFIVQYYNATVSGSRLDFQILLYDPQFHRTISGDSKILFQYKTVPQPQAGSSPSYFSTGLNSPRGDGGLNYCANNQYPVNAAPIAAQRALLFMSSAECYRGRLHGRVNDAEDGAPVAGALVYNCYGQIAITNQNGVWDMPGAWALDYSITAHKQGYNDSTYSDLALERDEEQELNFVLLHPEFIPSHQSRSAALDVDDRLELPLTVANIGNGPLTWRTEKRLRGDANNDPWEFRRTVPIGQITGDARIGGAVFVNDSFYVAGGDDPNTNFIYVLNRDNELIRSFEQAGSSSYGYIDLAWDGELIWGSGERNIFGFTPQGELVTQFTSLANPCNNLAWDLDHEVLWACGTTTDPVAYDREGNVVTMLSRCGLRGYGLAYYPEDPDGYNLYVLNNPSGTIQILHKISIATNDTLFVADLSDNLGGRPSSMEITNQWDVYSWVMMTVANNAADDRIDFWQVDGRKDWFDIAPVSGVINSGEAQDYIVTFDATGLPQVRFEGDIIFWHNADDGEFILPIALDVIGGIVNQELAFRRGWNMVSLNIQPNELDVREMFRPLVEAGRLVILKDGLGRFYRPDADFNNIPAWNPADGYQAYVTADCQLMLRGVVTPPDQPLALRRGWNICAYYPPDAVPAPTALSGIAAQLEIAKDGGGAFYMPEFGFCNMQPMRPGQGYLYKVRQELELIYQLQEGGAAVALTPRLNHFTIEPLGSQNASLLIMGEPGLKGWELGVFSESGQVSGAGVFDDQGRCGAAVWGESEPAVEGKGLTTGSKLNFILWDGAQEISAAFESIRGEAVWSADGVIVGRLSQNGLTPVKFGLETAFPNPFNATLKLVYGLDETRLVKLTLVDMQGREILRLAEGIQPSGRHTFTMDASSLPSGVYWAKLESAGKMQRIKVVCMK